MKNPHVKLTEEPVTGYEYQLGDRIKLSCPETLLMIPFGKVITNRRSTRKFNAVMLTQLSQLLWYTAKVKNLHLQENGYILTHRGAPSAGARHPIDIIVYNSTMFHREHFYYYNPFDHSLNLIMNEVVIAPFIIHINKIVNIGRGTLLWFVAHSQRTNSKYENADSLIWRDAGALINSIQLTCTALNLSSCPIGSLGEPYISSFFADPDVFGAGGIIIG
ncbi:SagB family peptide dehydrogenase [Mucilaginibacter daejeonensis]|uniref:SagB family peptide dehydrogenase n=1 Tax=Mucilaginibacter daejeonensis TaxID=398049 RepID=UPI001D1706CF|nr:SagB family peptide dehydrogenase [Mucilaginibacter daejeonensis]UEG51393.1 SagB family peptide dehydrogenase [Mucilaginibacter daejeonensis]